MKTFYFVRHGESETNAGDIILGEVTPLTEQGREQAEFIAKRASKLPIEHIVSSTAVRTKDTALAISKRLGLGIDHSDLFIEWQRGTKRIGRGKSDPEIRALDRRLLEHLRDTNYREADEENFEDLNARAIAAIEYLMSIPKNHILIAGHGLFTRVLVGRAIMGEDFTGAMCERFLRAMHTSNTGLTILEHNPESVWGAWRLVVWNDDAHLA